MHEDVLDMDQFRNKILKMAEESYGQGWIF